MYVSRAIKIWSGAIVKELNTPRYNEPPGTIDEHFVAAVEWARVGEMGHTHNDNTSEEIYELFEVSDSNNHVLHP